jgi:anaerobic magnesium-protoporphyrin IX monomethyl ester cyclase
MRFSNKHKVLFIVHDVYQEDNEFPLGPAYLAAVLKEAGASVEAYCMDVYHYTNEQLADHLDNNHYDLIGLGFLAARFEETVAPLCKVINQHKKDAWLVLGGHGPSPIPEYILRRTDADIIAVGESFNTIKDLLWCKIKGENLSTVKGIAYLDHKRKYFHTGESELIKNLDTLPFPLWEIFPMNKYTVANMMFNQDLKTEKSLNFMSSIGCTGRCNFCYRMDKFLRLRSIPNIIAELKILWEKYSVNCLFFDDELFVMNKARLTAFRDGLKEAGLKIKFTCSARVDTFDQETLDLLVECGCQGINFGFESCSTKVLSLMNKNTTAEQNIKVLELMKSDGRIGMGINFIWNNIGDTVKTLKGDAELIKKYNTYLSCRTIKPVTPYPGSDLYYQAMSKGLLSGPDDFFKKFKNSDLITVNFMNIKNGMAYQALLETNTELILDHYNHTQGNMNEANNYIKQLTELYEGLITNFRGTRHYNPQEQGGE